MYISLEDYYLKNEKETIRCADCSLRIVCHESRKLSADDGCLVGTINTLFMNRYGRLLEETELTKETILYNKFVFNNKLEPIKKVILVDTYDERTFKSFLINYKDTAIYNKGYPNTDEAKKIFIADRFNILFCSGNLLWKLNNKSLNDFDRLVKDSLERIPILFIDRIFNKSNSPLSDFSFIYEAFSYNQNLVIIDFYKNKNYYKRLAKEVKDLNIVVWDINK